MIYIYIHTYENVHLCLCLKSNLKIIELIASFPRSAVSFTSFFVDTESPDALAILTCAFALNSCLAACGRS